ncbi:putative ribonuclease H-like domain-containing protein [Tanacetum coccineum]
MVSRTILTRSGLISLNAARPVNTIQPRTTVNNVGPMKNVINNAIFHYHMTGNKSYLTDYEEIDGEFVAFGGNSKGGKITRKENVVPQEWSHLSFCNATTKWESKSLVIGGLDNVNFKTMNKCGKQHRASWYNKLYDDDSPDARSKPSEEEEKKDAEDPGNEDSEVPRTEEPRVNQEKMLVLTELTLLILLVQLIMLKCKTRLGYNVVPPPYNGNFMPPKSDLVYPSLDDFVDVNGYVSEPIVKKPIVETNEPKTTRKENEAPIIKEWINFVRSVEKVKSPRKTSVVKNRQSTPSPRGNKRNWNQHMSKKLGSNFEMFNKACHVCGSFDHLKNDCNNWYNNGRFGKPVWTNVQRVNKQNFSKLTHPSSKRNMIQRTVLTRCGSISLITTRPVNTVQSRTAVNNVGPMKNVINNAYSTARRLLNKITAANNSNFTKKVNTVKGTRVNIARPKAVISAVKENKGNAIKASACLVWRPKHKVLDHVSRNNGASMHMTGNRSYLTDYEEIDGGFVAIGGNSKGGEITGKCKIRTIKLDFEDVYFVKELKFNLFSVSQMRDKKNSVLFTDTGCVVLSPDFKLTDESHVLLKVPRKNNMYSVDLKNVVPQGGLTCLFAKATPNESNLWHKSLGHVNFKKMKKLVRGNLVRGIKNLIDLRVKVIRCDNGTEFKNKVMNQFCKMKGIKREFNVARTPQQNGVAERKNRTLIKAARTMLADLKLPTTFWTEADEVFFIGYSTNSKAFRVFNSRTRIVEENLHVQFSENTPNIAESRRNWLFDINALPKSMNYKPVIVGNQSNGNACTKACDDAGKARMETDSPDAGFKPLGEEEKKDAEDLGKDSDIPSIEEPRINQEKDPSVNSTNNINTVSPTVNATSIKDNDVDENIVYGCADDPNIPKLEDIIYSYDDEDVGVEADMNNLDAFMPVSPIPTTRIHKDHPVKQIIRDLNSAPQTRRMIKNLEEHVDLPNGKKAIGTKWVFGNKKDERGIVIKNKARLVAQGYTQEEGINYDEEVYVCQPPGFEILDFPDRVYKVEKALYGLHQAPRAWYETLSTYLFRKDKGDILLVQVYVDDIIFGSTKKSLCTKFEKMMHKKFQMSYMGELTFFLGLQVKQKKDGVFISQAKYVTEILKKFGFSDVKTTSTPMETQKPLLKDVD